MIPLLIKCGTVNKLLNVIFASIALSEKVNIFFSFKNMYLGCYEDTTSRTMLGNLVSTRLIYLHRLFLYVHTRHLVIIVDSGTWE